ncbi:MAG: hypothetical protein ACREE0_19195 [Phenylobacterium sp.]
MSLEEYRLAHERWLEWLDGDPVHSINGQLSQLMWQDAVFRTFNEARKDTEAAGPSAAVAPILAQFLDQGYVASQVLGISKLVEYSDPKQPKKGVISLRRLLDDVIAHHGLLTRANFLGLEGAPYDYAPIRAREIQAQLAKAQEGEPFFWHGDGGQADWGKAERMHAQFDRLSDVAPEARSPDDLVSMDLLERLNAALNDEVFSAIRILRHKTIAHAADAFSRGQVDKAKSGLSFNEVDRAARILLSVRQVLQAGVLFSSWRAGAVPVPQHNQFEFLDLPFARQGAVGGLQGFWAAHSEVRDEWLGAGYDALLNGEEL